MTDDNSIHARISSAIEEAKLRDDLAAGRITQEHEHQRIRALEDELDQLWDLLRQRQGERDAGRDPNRASMRPVDEVEGYLG